MAASDNSSIGIYYSGTPEGIAMAFAPLVHRPRLAYFQHVQAGKREFS